MAERTPSAPGELSFDAIDPNRLRRRLDAESLSIKSTADAEPLTGLVGQDRALAAIEVGMEISQRSFHTFILGPPGAGKTTAIRSFLKTRTAQKAAADDWIYVNNFDVPHKPRAIAMPRDRADGLSRAMVNAVDELRTAIPAMFDSEEYQSRRSSIDGEVEQWQEESFETLNKRAAKDHVAIIRTPLGFTMAPTSDGKVIKPNAFNALPEEERTAVQEKIEGLQTELEAILKQIPRLQKIRHKGIRELNEELATVAVRTAMSEVQADFGDLPEIAAHLARVGKDMVSHVNLFTMSGDDDSEALEHQAETEKDPRYRRYMVNVVISGSQSDTPPIEEVTNPTLSNLVGRIEHLPQMGTLVTDFLLIKPGALHRANGGFLLIDARKLLMQPFSWEALKRALKTREIAIESPAEQLSLVSTVSLEPDRIPLQVKAVLLGERMLYYLLSALDPDFAGLFKIAADFEDTMEFSADNVELFARLVASIVARRDLRHVDAGGVARLVEESARLASDSEKLTLRIEPVADLLSEADYWAGKSGRDVITAEEVARAVSENIRRLDRLRDRTQESILRDIVLVDSSGARIGQVNGLSVLSVGSFSFGRPSRITARARMGTGRLVDIEREVELGGPLHSKGVMILRGFLEGRYAREMPLSLSASLVFEQSYGGVDGDSASSAELYALLSALADVPIRQSIAVTGSVNQHGVVQAIGGVNEKIEGFFDICNQRGLTGDQGVIIPHSNQVHLMLREDVVEAARQGQFHVYAIGTIDEGIEILTGRAAGERDDDGLFPECSINRLVEDRLIEFAVARRRYGIHGEDEQDAPGRPS